MNQFVSEKEKHYTKERKRHINDYGNLLKKKYSKQISLLILMN